MTEVLGGTALATVYRAQDTENGREVALKVLRPYFSQEQELLERFIEYMGEVQQLSHSNIRPMDSVEREDDTIWIVEQLAPGPSIREWLRGPINPRKAVTILRQVGEAVDFAHGRGILHHNIKPSNIFVSDDGKAVLTGFGMVILAQGINTLVRTSLSTPLPTYTAPEQAQGFMDNHSSDIYSLGVLFYEMVTGTVPFHGLSEANILNQQLRSYPSPPSHINMRLPEALDEIMLKALNRRAEERYSTAKEFVEALEDIIAGQPEEPIFPQESTESSATSQEPSRTVVVASDTEEVVVCQACGHPNQPGTVYCLECWRSLGSIGAVDKEIERELTRKRRSAIRRSRIVRLSVILAVVLVLASWLAYKNIGTPQFMAAPTSAISSSSGSGEWVMYQRDLGHTGFTEDQSPVLDGEVKWQFQTGAPFLSSPAVVGNQVYISTGDRRIVALNAETGAIVWEYPVTGPVDSSPAVAGDILFVGLRDGRVLALDRNTGKLRWAFHVGNPVYSSPAVSDGIIYFGAASSKLFALDAATGEERWSYFTGQWIVTSPALNDEVVAVVAQDRNVYIIEIDTAKKRLVFSLGNYARASPVLHGDRLYIADESGKLWAVDWWKREYPFERALRRWQAQFVIWGILDNPPIPKGFVWSFRERGGWFYSTPAVAWDKVYVTSLSGNIFAVDEETGKEVWRFQAAAPIETSPSIVQKTVYVGDTGGNLYALDADTGEKQWEFKAGGGISSTAVVANGTLYIGAQDGILYALK